MVHWSEGRPREHPHDDFPPRDSGPVRAFVAIRMSSAVEDAVAAAIEELSLPRDGVRWVPRANLHVTLKFLGPAVDSHRLERIASGLHEIASRTTPFEVEARGIGGFPDLEHPRAIWVGLHSVALGALAARLESKAVECGFERDDRRWNGHLTIGRLRGSRLKSETRKMLREASARYFGVSQVESITLYRSHPGAASASYEALATLLFHRPGLPS